MGTAGIGTSQPLPVGSLALKEDKSNKGAASGYAPLDSGSKVPVANLPAASGAAAGTQSAADYSKLAALPSAAQLVARTINPQTGTTYAVVAADAYEQGRALTTLENANPITVTVPKQATTAIDVGQTFNFQQIGAGQVTFAAEDGDVTINPAATLKISAQWKGATLVKTATNVWSLIGSLSA
jgi:hypothetical protein